MQRVRESSPYLWHTDRNRCSPSHGSLGRWLWALERSPGRSTWGVFIIHGVCCIEIFLPECEEVDSHWAARAAQPPPALLHATA